MQPQRVLVLFPTVEEFNAAVGRTNGTAIIPCEQFANGVCRWWVKPTEKMREHLVYLALLDGQGKAVQERARDLIAETQPHVVIVAGICGGARGRDLGIGDVAISKRLVFVSREKRHVDGTTVRDCYCPDDSEQFSAVLSRFGIERKLTAKLRKCSKYFRALSAAFSVKTRVAANAEAKRHFERLISLGPRVNMTTMLSTFTNWQGPERPLDDLRPAFLDLSSCEMEVEPIWNAMRELGRTDLPFAVKVISDIPGLILNQSVKQAARRTAAVAIRELLLLPETWNAMCLLPIAPTIPRKSLRTASHSTGMDHLEAELKSSHPNRKLVRAITQEFRSGVFDAVEAATLLDYYHQRCPRCAGGSEEILPFRDLFAVVIDKLATVQGEELRAAKLLMKVAGIGPGIVLRQPDRFEQRILNALETKVSVNAFDAATGLIYHYLVNDLSRATPFLDAIQAKNLLPHRTRACWQFAEFHARIARGEGHQIVRKAFASEWKQNEDEYATNHRLSFDILPLLTELNATIVETRRVRKSVAKEAARIAEEAETPYKLAPVLKLAACTLGASELGIERASRQIRQGVSRIRSLGITASPLVSVSRLFESLDRQLTRLGWSDLQNDLRTCSLPTITA